MTAGMNQNPVRIASKSRTRRVFSRDPPAWAQHTPWNSSASPGTSAVVDGDREVLVLRFADHASPGNTSGSTFRLELRARLFHVQPALLERQQYRARDPRVDRDLHSGQIDPPFQ